MQHRALKELKVTKSKQYIEWFSDHNDHLRKKIRNCMNCLDINWKMFHGQVATENKLRFIGVYQMQNSKYKYKIQNLYLESFESTLKH